MSKLENWIAKNKPARKISKFEKYRDEIEILISKNYTQNQICEYLQDIHNVEATRSNLSKYLKKINQNTVKKKEQNQSQEQKNEEYLKILENMGNVN